MTLTRAPTLTPNPNPHANQELFECVARCGVDKYKGVAPMPPAAAVRGFVQNLLGKANEEEVVKQFAVEHHL